MNNRSDIMKIGIIVYSQTGNTYSVVSKLKEKLGNSATVLRLETVGEVKPSKIKIKEFPKVDKYGVLILAAPVQAFSLCIPMLTYLNGLDSLKNKKVGLVVTQGFPYAWMGGNRAIRQMINICKLKGATIIGTGIVNWLSKKREDMINTVIDDFSSLLGDVK